MLPELGSECSLSGKGYVKERKHQYFAQLSKQKASLISKYFHNLKEKIKNSSVLCCSDILKQ